MKKMTIPIQKLLKEVNSYYKLVLVASRRANDLSGGGQPLVALKSKKVGINALEEIARGKVHFEEKAKVKPSKPKKPAKTAKAKK
jgi:DNA-directed RNA polymerase omega subunit